MLGCSWLHVCKLVVEVGGNGAVGGWDCADFRSRNQRLLDFECLGVHGCMSAS